MAGRFPLGVGSKANKSKPWKAGRAVGTTCACAFAYGRRDAPSPVGLCLLCLDLFTAVMESRKSTESGRKGRTRCLPSTYNCIHTQIRYVCELHAPSGVALYLVYTYWSNTKYVQKSA